MKSRKWGGGGEIGKICGQEGDDGNRRKKRQMKMEKREIRK